MALVSQVRVDFTPGRHELYYIYQNAKLRNDGEMMLNIRKAVMCCFLGHFLKGLWGTKGKTKKDEIHEHTSNINDKINTQELEVKKMSRKIDKILKILHRFIAGTETSLNKKKRGKKTSNKNGSRNSKTKQAISSSGQKDHDRFKLTVGEGEENADNNISGKKKGESDSGGDDTPNVDDTSDVSENDEEEKAPDSESDEDDEDLLVSRKHFESAVKDIISKIQSITKILDAVKGLHDTVIDHVNNRKQIDKKSVEELIELLERKRNEQNGQKQTAG
jgi:hypothetical protein